MLPEGLRDSTFAAVLKDDLTTQRWLGQLLMQLGLNGGGGGGGSGGGATGAAAGGSSGGGNNNNGQGRGSGEVLAIMLLLGGDYALLLAKLFRSQVVGMSGSMGMSNSMNGDGQQVTRFFHCNKGR